MTGIYKITSPSEKVYIGQSTDIQTRFGQYRRLECKSQTKLFRSFNKYGHINHIFEIIEECLFEELNIRERYWQDFYNVVSKKGLNCMLTETENLPGKMSDETKEKISKANKGKVRSEEIRLMISNTQKGRIQSKELIEKRVEGRKGYRHSEETKLKMSKSTFKREVIDTITNVVYESCVEVCKIFNLKKVTLRRKLSGFTKNNTQFEYTTPNENGKGRAFEKINK